MWSDRSVGPRRREFYVRRTVERFTSSASAADNVFPQSLLRTETRLAAVHGRRCACAERTTRAAPHVPASGGGDGSLLGSGTDRVTTKAPVSCTATRPRVHLVTTSTAACRNSEDNMSGEQRNFSFLLIISRSLFGVWQKKLYSIYRFKRVIGAERWSERGGEKKIITIRKRQTMFPSVRSHLRRI